MNFRRAALDVSVVVGLFFAIGAFPYFFLAVFGPYQGMSVSQSPASIALSVTFLTAGAIAFAAGIRLRKGAALTKWEAVVLGSIVLLFVDFLVPPFGFLFVYGNGGMNFVILILSLLGIVIGCFEYDRKKEEAASEAHMAPSHARHMGVYVLIFVLAFLAAAGFYIWPVFAFSGAHSCPAVLADLSFQISGSNPIASGFGGPGYHHEVVGQPLFSQTQLVLQPSYVAYITYVYDSTMLGNNMTEPLSGFGSPPYTVAFLYRIDPWTGQFEEVAANQTGVSFTLLGTYFSQSDTIARQIWEVSISKSAEPASYALAIPCGTPGLVLTVGSLPYWGPIQWSSPQLSDFLVNVAVALVGATAISVALRWYWRRTALREQGTPRLQPE